MNPPFLVAPGGELPNEISNHPLPFEQTDEIGFVWYHPRDQVTNTTNRTMCLLSNGAVSVLAPFGCAATAAFQCLATAFTIIMSFTVMIPE